MKILHVIDQISQKTGGGASKVAFELAHAQARLGHDVTIYSTDFNAKNQAAPRGVKLVKFQNWFNLFDSLSTAPGLLFAKYDYDIMHLHNYRTIVNLFASFRHKPTILQAHGSSMPIVGKTKALHDAMWNTAILKAVDYCIADADVEVQHYLNEGTKRENIIMIPVGINFAEFKRLPARTEKEYKTILFLGRIHEVKGIDLLIHAFYLMHNSDRVRLQISGVDYGYQDEVKALINKLGLEVFIDYTGPLYGANKVKAFTNADVFVMPSRYEMWGLTFMEALACGTAVIMTDTCEASKMLPPECGTVVPLDVEAISEAIKATLVTNLGNRYREYRRQWVTQYNWDNIAPQIIRLYEEVLNG